MANLIMARIDPFGLGMSAFADGISRSACPFSQDFFEGRQWQLGWDFGSSRARSGKFVEQLA